MYRYAKSSNQSAFRSSYPLTNDQIVQYAPSVLADHAHQDRAADSVLRPNRYEDRKPDLWTTFNRIQENIIRGGVRGHTTTGKRTTTREVGGVSENVRLNKALWALADGMAQIKTGAHSSATELVAA